MNSAVTPLFEPTYFAPVGKSIDFHGKINCNMPLTPVPGASAVCHVRGFSFLG
jgi:hypothetical protein